MTQSSLLVGRISCPRGSPRTRCFTRRMNRIAGGKRTKARLPVQGSRPASRSFNCSAEAMRVVCLLLMLAPLLPAQSQSVLNSLASGSYFPLEVGNRWVYRLDDRLQTAQYQTWRIDREEQRNGKTYAAMTVIGPGTVLAEFWFRADSSGKVYMLSDTGDRLFLDPTGTQLSTTDLQVTGQQSTYTSGFGTFQDAIAYVNRTGGLILETGVLGRGVGLITSTSILQTGSSGGFIFGRTLVDATLGGAEAACNCRRLRCS